MYRDIGVSRGIYVYIYIYRGLGFRTGVLRIQGLGLEPCTWLWGPLVPQAFSIWCRRAVTNLRFSGHRLTV